MKTHLGSTLNSLLRHKKMTQIELAKNSGVSQSQINNIIKGSRPRAENLKKICARNSWGDPVPGIELILDHLRDEANRSGRSDDVCIQPRIGGNPDARNLINSIESLAAKIPSAVEPLQDIIDCMLYGIQYAADDAAVNQLAVAETGP